MIRKGKLSKIVNLLTGTVVIYDGIPRRKVPSFLPLKQRM